MGQLLMCILGSTKTLKRRSPELAADIVDNLRDLAEDPDEVDLYEKATGIKSKPNGILFDREVSKVVNLPDCVYLDLTHYMVLVV